MWIGCLSRRRRRLDVRRTAARRHAAYGSVEIERFVSTGALDDGSGRPEISGTIPEEFRGRATPKVQILVARLLPPDFRSYLRAPGSATKLDVGRRNFVASCHGIPCGGPAAAIRIYARICWS